MKFANSKKRIIQESAKGRMFVKTEKGAKSYNPTAMFKVMNNGSMVKLTAANKNMVPKAVRSTKLNKPPAGMRAVAKAAAAKAARRAFPKPRGRPVNKMGQFKKAAAVAAKKAFPKPRGRPAKSNSAVQGNQFRKIFKTPVARKARSNKGAARGPREGAILRKMNTNSRAMAARKAPKRKANMLTPEEAELYRIIFGTPTKGRPTKMAAPFRAANKKPKNAKRVAAGRKAAATRKLKAMPNKNPFNALR